MRRHRHKPAATYQWCLPVGFALLTGCATTQALIEAPEEFWMTVERLLMAMWSDIESLIFLLGL